MMMFIMSLFFLIPVIMINNYYLFMFWLLILFMFFIFNISYNFNSLISYMFGLDLISWSFVILSLWIIFLMLNSGYNCKYSSKSKELGFMIFFLLLFLVFSFMSMSFFMFYIFFESSLIPTLFLIFGWGYQPERLMAGFYLIFYTLFASLPLLLGIFYIWYDQGVTFYWMIDLESNFYLFLCLTLAFLIKMPLVMFHFWLPKAHVEAPIFGSMILAGVLLKLGGYGLIRVSLFLYNDFMMYSLYLVSLSLFGGIFCGMICCVQLDMKILVAYSSVCHMSMCIMGIFTVSWWGILGSFILMLAHGLCSSGLFCLVNIVYERSGSRSFLINKGFIILMPSMCLFWFILCSNNMGSPLSLKFIWWINVNYSLISWSNYLILYLMFLSFLSCVYSMYLFSFVNHGILSSFIFLSSSCNLREFMLIFYHLFPLNMFSLKFYMFLTMI
uniref:NADH-ubiquinone oxidoreductase chain 4 n=1 Tax=Perissonemia borneenis TaxID=1964418 RepID=A0A343BT86_9HEMI|nr:NADH dehydrogenase subunit 4 [Perissonemia borneenis]